MGELADQVHFNRYSKVATLSGLTGAQAAQRILDGGRASRDVTVTRSSGFLPTTTTR